MRPDQLRGCQSGALGHHRTLKADTPPIFHYDDIIAAFSDHVHQYWQELGSTGLTLSLTVPAHCLTVLSTSLARRYSREVGTGRFKHVYKGFDERQGIDIAWSRILQQANNLSDEQMTAIVAELDKGLELDHPNIIRCYRAWHDKEQRCINFITEFFTSGNLRDFRQRHKHLEVST